MSGGASRGLGTQRAAQCENHRGQSSSQAAATAGRTGSTTLPGLPRGAGMLTAPPTVSGTRPTARPGPAGCQRREAGEKYSQRSRRRRQRYSYRSICYAGILVVHAHVAVDEVELDVVVALGRRPEPELVEGGVRPDVEQPRLCVARGDLVDLLTVAEPGHGVGGAVPGRVVQRRCRHPRGDGGVEALGQHARRRVVPLAQDGPRRVLGARTLDGRVEHGQVRQPGRPVGREVPCVGCGDRHVARGPHPVLGVVPGPVVGREVLPTPPVARQHRRGVPASARWPEVLELVVDPVVHDRPMRRRDRRERGRRRAPTTARAVG